MKEIIINKLSEIEKSYNIKILYAIESGSRGWGFESPDSDYDIRFIYIHKPEWYLSIYAKKDVIELPFNNLLDINGWDSELPPLVEDGGLPVLLGLQPHPSPKARTEPFFLVAIVLSPAKTLVFIYTTGIALNILHRQGLLPATLYIHLSMYYDIILP